MEKTITQKSAPKKRRRVASLDKKKARAGWIFILPFVVGFILIYLPMVVQSIRYTFQESFRVTDFVGFAHYSEALTVHPTYTQTLTTGLTQLVLDIPAIVIFSLVMAVMLNQKMLGRAAFRAIFFIPVILSTGLIDQINNQGNTLMQYLDTNEGVETGQETSASDIVSRADLEFLFDSMKIGGGLAEYVHSLVQNIYNIVNRCGVQMLIFLAGLQSISPAIYESCSIDGATAWETFWKITFPMISPMILVNTIYTVIDAFTSGQNEVMQLVSETYTTDMILSSAMAWMYFVIVIAIIAVVAGVLSAYIFYQRRD